MKTKILTLTLAFVLAAFGVYVYKYPPISQIVNPDVICMNYKEKPNTLSVGLIHDMVDGYVENQLVDINKTGSTTTIRKGTGVTTINDARAIWFDLKTLKRFIYHLEINSKINNVPVSDDKLGIRIYYASYPDNSTWGNTYTELGVFTNNPITMDYEYRHTLVMIPTIRNKKGIDIDFNPRDANTYSNGLSSDYYLNTDTDSGNYNANQTIGLSTFPSTSREVGAQNHGGSYPPLGDAGLGF